MLPTKYMKFILILMKEGWKIMAANSNDRIGFVGLGNMGRHMVNNLIKSGYEVYVYDKQPKSVQLCVGFGAHAVESLKQLMETCDIIHIAVLTDDQVKSVVTGDEWIVTGCYS